MHSVVYCIVLLWSICRFWWTHVNHYPYLLGVLHWRWGNHMITPLTSTSELILKNMGKFGWSQKDTIKHERGAYLLRCTGGTRNKDTILITGPLCVESIGHICFLHTAWSVLRQVFLYHIMIRNSCKKYHRRYPRHLDWKWDGKTQTMKLLYDIMQMTYEEAANVVYVNNHILSNII